MQRRKLGAWLGMATGDSATVFLETTLGTRLAVSFPVRATTISDLKGQVAAQHSACFPDIGPIAVASLQVKIDELWYVLTDPMAVQDAFVGISGRWHLRVEARQLPSVILASKDPNCATGDTGHNVSHPVAEENMLPPAVPQAGPGNVSSGDQQDKPPEGVEHASGQLEDDNSIPQQNSDLGIAERNIGKTNQRDKPQEGIDHASRQHKDGSTMPQQSSDLVAAADKDSGQLGDQQIVETREKKRFRKEHKNEGSIAVYRDGSLISLASSTHSVELSDKTSNKTEHPNVKYISAYTARDPLLYSLGYHWNGLRGKLSCVEKGLWTFRVCSGESSDGRSDIWSCIGSMEGDNFSEKELKAHRSEEDEPRIAGLLCTTESRCKGRDTPHCVESMKEDSRGLTSNDHYLDTEATSTVITEHEACFPRRQRLLAAREVPMSRAKKIYAFRAGSSPDAHQAGSIKEGAQKLNEQDDSEPEVRSSPRISIKGVPIGEKAVLRKMQHNLEVPGVKNRGSAERFAQEDGAEEPTRRGKKKMKIKKINGI